MSVAKLDDGVLAADVAMVDLNVVRVETADGSTTSTRIRMPYNVFKRAPRSRPKKCMTDHVSML